MRNRHLPWGAHSPPHGDAGPPAPPAQSCTRDMATPLGPPPRRLPRKIRGRRRGVDQRPAGPTLHAPRCPFHQGTHHTRRLPRPRWEFTFPPRAETSLWVASLVAARCLKGCHGTVTPSRHRTAARAGEGGGGASKGGAPQTQTTSWRARAMRDQRAGEGKGRGEEEEEELAWEAAGEGREDEWERAVEEEEKEKEEPPQTRAPSWRTRAAGTREASFALLAHGSNFKGRGMESGSGEGQGLGRIRQARIYYDLFPTYHAAPADRSRSAPVRSVIRPLSPRAWRPA